MLFKDVRVKDVNGDEVNLNTLVSRLRFRQDKRRKTHIAADESLNLIVCWDNHVFFDKRDSDTCRECGKNIRYRVIEGIYHE